MVPAGGAQRSRCRGRAAHARASPRLTFWQRCDCMGGPAAGFRAAAAQGERRALRGPGPQPASRDVRGACQEPGGFRQAPAGPGNGARQRTTLVALPQLVARCAAGDRACLRAATCRYPDTQSTPSAKTTLSLIREIWSILTASQRRRVVATQAISVLMAFSTLIGIASIAPFFAVLGDPHLIAEHRLLHSLYSRGGFHDVHSFEFALGGGFIALVLAANLMNATGLLLLRRLALGIGIELQAALFEEYLDRPYLFHCRTNSATLLHNVVYEVSRLNNGILQNGFVLVTQLVTASLIVLSVLLLDPRLAATMLLTLAGGYLMIYLGVRARLLRLGERHAHAWSERSRFAAESFSAIREILLLEDRKVFLERFAQTSEQAARTGAHIQVVAQLPKYIMEGFGAVALVGAALAFATRGGGMAASLGELTFVAFAAYRLLPILQQIFFCCVEIRADTPGFALIAPDLRSVRAAQTRLRPSSARVADGWRGRPREEILLDGVSF